jgi:glycosyltransferase involved in cell wall biosynthesis
MQKPKILICLSSNRWGGGERHVFDLCSGLGDEIEFELMVQGGGILEKKTVALNIPVWTHDFNQGLSPLKYFNQVRWLQEQNYDGIHCHLHQASRYISLMRPFLNPKIIATVHGISTSLYYLCANHLIVVSNAVLDSLWPGLAHKSTQIYNGVEAVLPTVQKAMGLPQSYIFATVHRNKGQAFVLDALKDQSLKTSLTLVGEGHPENMRELERLHAGLRASDSVTLVFLTGDLGPYWKNAAFIVIPSYQEALSYVALEALARGIPVLASATGGLKEVVTEGFDGLFFEPGNVRSFQKNYMEMETAFSRLAKNLEAMPFLNRRPEFRIKTMIEKTRKVYQQIFAL